jgi:site-specific DNA recombinase
VGSDHRFGPTPRPAAPPTASGPDRVDYWRQCLRKAQAKTKVNKITIPERLAEIDTEIADLERRLNRQILNLESDDLTPTARTQIVARIGDLETAIT